jgi:Adenomatosis polyposis coli down-regulated 1
MKKYILTAAAVLTSLVSLASAAQADDSAPLHFRSATCETLALIPGEPLSHVIRDFLIYPKLGRHNVVYHYFDDAECKKPLMTFNADGRVKSGDAVANIPGATKTDVYFDRVLVTAESPKGVSQVEKCGKGNWEVGVQQDVTETGCLLIYPKAGCGVDMDIVKVADGVLTPGVRTENMCTEAGRPTELQSSGAPIVQ